VAKREIMNSKVKKATIIITSILFGLTLNSCKKCSKETKPPEDRNGTADGSDNQGNGSTGDNIVDSNAVDPNAKATADFVKQLADAKNKVDRLTVKIGNHEKQARQAREKVDGKMSFLNKKFNDIVKSTQKSVSLTVNAAGVAWEIMKDVNVIFDDVKKNAMAGSDNVDVKNAMRSLEEAVNIASNMARSAAKAALEAYMGVGEIFERMANEIPRNDIPSLICAYTNVAIVYANVANLAEDADVFDNNLQLSKAALGKAKFIRHRFSDNQNQEIQQEIQQIFDNTMDELKKALPDEEWDDVNAPEVEVEGL
jgi:hypothetical protein